jgi:3-hydroxyacyl-CoA dehydrogenase
MHLVELIPTDTTRPEILDQLETFLTSVVGKGVVRAKDTPNFIANRVGDFLDPRGDHRSGKFGLRFDEVDDLTGARVWAARSRQRSALLTWSVSTPWRTSSRRCRTT